MNITRKVLSIFLFSIVLLILCVGVNATLYHTSIQSGTTCDSSMVDPDNSNYCLYIADPAGQCNNACFNVYTPKCIPGTNICMPAWTLSWVGAGNGAFDCCKCRYYGRDTTPEADCGEYLESGYYCHYGTEDMCTANGWGCTGTEQSKLCVYSNSPATTIPLGDSISQCGGVTCYCTTDGYKFASSTPSNEAECCSNDECDLAGAVVGQDPCNSNNCYTYCDNFQCKYIRKSGYTDCNGDSNCEPFYGIAPGNCFFDSQFENNLVSSGACDTNDGAICSSTEATGRDICLAESPITTYNNEQQSITLGMCIYDPGLDGIMTDCNDNNNACLKFSCNYNENCHHDIDGDGDKEECMTDGKWVDCTADWQCQDNEMCSNNDCVPETCTDKNDCNDANFCVEGLCKEHCDVLASSDTNGARCSDNYYSYTHPYSGMCSIGELDSNIDHCDKEEVAVGSIGKYMADCYTRNHAGDELRLCDNDAHPGFSPTGICSVTVSRAVLPSSYTQINCDPNEVCEDDLGVYRNDCSLCVDGDSCDKDVNPNDYLSASSLNADGICCGSGCVGSASSNCCSNDDCGAYACASYTCKTTCSSNADCADSSYFCLSGECVSCKEFESGLCSDGVDNDCDGYMDANDIDCKLTNGEVCTTDSDCKSNQCDLDFFGTKRCHSQNKCIYDSSGNEFSNGYEKCYNDEYYKSCTSGVWQSQVSCEKIIENEGCRTKFGSCTSGSVGKCSPPSYNVAAGTICIDEPFCRNGLVYTGKACDGSGYCSTQIGGTSCPPATCGIISGNVYEAKTQSTCSGGACTSQTTTSCGAYNCNGNICRTSCTQDSHCITDNNCIDNECSPCTASETFCDDGLDNDCDGDIDIVDSDCAGCSTSTPPGYSVLTISKTGLCPGHYFAANNCYYSYTGCKDTSTRRCYYEDIHYIYQDGYHAASPLNTFISDICYSGQGTCTDGEASSATGVSIRGNGYVDGGICYYGDMTCEPNNAQSGASCTMTSNTICDDDIACQSCDPYVRLNTAECRNSCVTDNHCVQDYQCVDGACSPCVDNDVDGYSTYGGDCGAKDCDDNNPNIYPGAQEVCNGVDENCDTLIDEMFIGSYIVRYCACIESNILEEDSPEKDPTDGGVLLNYIPSKVKYKGHAGNWYESPDSCYANILYEATCNNALFYGAGIPGYGPGSASKLISMICPLGCDTTSEGAHCIYDQDGDGFCNNLLSTSQNMNDYERCLLCTPNENPDCENEDYGTPVYDCDDSNSNINPDAVEVCANEIDDNCNGEVDEGCLVCTDVDLDEYSIQGGECGEVDCDDDNPNVYPGAQESCNDVDDDCDGFIDAKQMSSVGFGPFKLYYCDCTEDNLIEQNSPTINPHDTVSLIHIPSVTQYKDALGVSKQKEDVCTSPTAILEAACKNEPYFNDGTPGYGTGVPTSSEPLGLYNSCYLGCVPTDESAYCEYDIDDDGYCNLHLASSSVTTDYERCLLCTPDEDPDCENGEYGTPVYDCNDEDANVNQGMTEICSNDIDDNCNGEVDENCLSCTDIDDDGYSIEGGDCGTIDCNDNNPDIYPGAQEVCNGVDENCDTLIDEIIVGSYFVRYCACSESNSIEENSPIKYSDGGVSLSYIPSKALFNNHYGVPQQYADLCSDENFYESICNNNLFFGEGIPGYGPQDAATLHSRPCPFGCVTTSEGAHCVYDVDGDGYCNSFLSSSTTITDYERCLLCTPDDDPDCANEDYGTPVYDCDDNDPTVNENCLVCTDNDGDGYSIEGGDCGDIDCDDDNFNVNPGVSELTECNGVDEDCDDLVDTIFVGTDKVRYCACSELNNLEEYYANEYSLHGTTFKMIPSISRFVNSAGVIKEFTDNCFSSNSINEAKCGNHIYYPDGSPGYGPYAPGSFSVLPCNLGCVPTDAGAHCAYDLDGDGYCNENMGGKDYEKCIVCEPWQNPANCLNGNYDPVIYDCDDNDPTLNETCLICTDNDNDGYSIQGGECGDLDCNDDNDLVYPGAQETCNSLDDNCNDLVDEIGSIEYALTNACGGWGDTPVEACGGGDEDCDGLFDEIGSIEYALRNACDQCGPEPVEVCDDDDNDCDGEKDENLPLLDCYLDSDNDGYGSTLTQVCYDFCDVGYVTQDGDCDDSDAEISPSDSEICDGLDNDCDGDVDENLATMTCYTDSDGDEFGNINTAQSSCAGACAAGQVTIAGDCDDSNAQINLDAAEVCDGIDNNCKDGIDSDDYNMEMELCDNQQGECQGEEKTCLGAQGWEDCTGLLPAETICDDGLDNDCDGTLDYEGLNTLPNDEDCEVSLSGIEVSKLNPCPGETIEVYCTANAPNLDSIEIADDLGCTFVGWIEHSGEYRKKFECNSGDAGSTAVACYIDETMATEVPGTPIYVQTLTVGGGDCCSQNPLGNCANDPGCMVCELCEGDDSLRSRVGATEQTCTSISSCNSGFTCLKDVCGAECTESNTKTETCNNYCIDDFTLASMVSDDVVTCSADCTWPEATCDDNFDTTPCGQTTYTFNEKNMMCACLNTCSESGASASCNIDCDIDYTIDCSCFNGYFDSNNNYEDGCDCQKTHDPVAFDMGYTNYEDLACSQELPDCGLGDGVDNDCNGQVDETVLTDYDGDGSPDVSDCWPTDNTKGDYDFYKLGDPTDAYYIDLDDMHKYCYEIDDSWDMITNTEELWEYCVTDSSDPNYGMFVEQYHCVKECHDGVYDCDSCINPVIDVTLNDEDNDGVVDVCDVENDLDSCTDGLDNDADGVCDVAGCMIDGVEHPADPACDDMCNSCEECGTGFWNKCEDSECSYCGSKCNYVGTIFGECITDSDEDEIADDVDNCLLTQNTDQLDQDEDGLGDACDDCPINNKIPLVYTLSTTEYNNCTDGVDNDCNGVADCDDEICENAVACGGMGECTPDGDNALSSNKKQLCNKGEIYTCNAASPCEQHEVECNNEYQICQDQSESTIVYFCDSIAGNWTIAEDDAGKVCQSEEECAGETIWLDNPGKSKSEWKYACVINETGMDRDNSFEYCTNQGINIGNCEDLYDSYCWIDGSSHDNAPCCGDDESETWYITDQDNPRGCVDAEYINDADYAEGVCRIISEGGVLLANPCNNMGDTGCWRDDTSFGNYKKCCGDDGNKDTWQDGETDIITLLTSGMPSTCVQGNWFVADTGDDLVNYISLTRDD